jgi:manganese/iron transport system ATP-binding protein
MDKLTSQEPARLDIENISVGYNGAPVLQDVSFQIPHGARVAVVGPNGAGKSTLFKALVGLLPLRSGRIFIHQMPLGHHLDCVAYVPQRGEVDWSFPVTVADVVMMGRFGQMKWLQMPGRTDQAIVRKSMEQMGIADLANRSIKDLSGGQQQRVFLARALTQQPHIFLMDEPFTGVDATTQEATMQLLDHLRQQKVTVLISTHDLTLASTRFDSILLLNKHLLAFGTPEQVLSPDHLKQAFGSHVLKLPGGDVLVDECCPPDSAGSLSRPDSAGSLSRPDSAEFLTQPEDEHGAHAEMQ